MNLGDIVEYEGHRWRVFRLDKNVRTATLIRWSGTTAEVADDDPKAAVVANPCEWPVVTARLKHSSGPLVKLSVARGGRMLSLRPLEDWLPSDPMRSGGSVFINPKFKLMVGEVLIAEYKDGSASRIPITKRYGSMAQRKAVRASVPAKKGLMGLLDGDDFIE